MLSFLSVFMGYSALFLAPWTVSTAHDPQYTVIWMSSNVVNFVIPGRFHGLERTVLAPGMISTARDPLVHGNFVGRQTS